MSDGDESNIATTVASMRVRLDGMDRESHEWRAQLQADQQHRFFEISQGMEKLSAQVSALSAKLSDSRVTNWFPLLSVTIAATLLFITIGGLTLAPIISGLNSLKQEVEKNEINFRGHEKLELHPVGYAKVTAINEKLSDRADINAQRIASLDAKQDAENARLMQLFEQRIGALAKEFEEVKKEGSPVTRDRLMSLEEFRKEIEKPKP